MEKQENAITNYNHGISMFERKNLVVTGVKKVDNFDPNQFIIESVMGYIIIKGRELELVKLDTMQGNVNIKGTINSINYADDSIKKDHEESIFSRLFR